MDADSPIKLKGGEETMSHLTPEQWQRYRTGRLQPGELAQIDAHLSACPECRARLLSDEQTRQAIARLRAQLFAPLPSECPTYDQLADYLDEQLSEDERLQVEEHLQSCPLCVQEVQALKEWRKTVPEQLPAPSPQKSWKQRLATLLTNRWLIAWEGVALVVLVFFVALRHHQQALINQWQQVNFSLAHLHGHLQKLQEQVQSLQQSQRQLADLRNQLTTLQRKLEARQRVGEPSLPLMTLKDTAGTVVITGDRRLQLPVALADEWRRRIFDLLTEGKISQPAKVKMAMAKVGEKIAVRGEIPKANSPQLISPVNTAVFPDQIVFRWKGVKEATQYRLSIADENGTKILWESPPIHQTHWSLPARALKLGSVYTWQVEATVGGEKMVSPPARFFVLDNPSASLVRKMERQFSRSALTLITVYATYGLREEALAQFHRLRRQNPNHPAIEMLREALLKVLPKESPSP